MLDWCITLIPCAAGLLATLIAKFEFTRHSQALCWAADALESELWRYRSRTGRYCARASSWTALMENELGRSFSVAHHPQQALNEYVRKQQAIKHDKEIERFHAQATCVECLLFRMIATSWQTYFCQDLPAIKVSPPICF